MNQPSAPLDALKSAHDGFRELFSLLEGAQALLLREEEGITTANDVLEVASRLAHEYADDVADALHSVGTIAASEAASSGATGLR